MASNVAPNPYEDTFSERKPHHDVSLLVENRIFWISRGYLAQYSPVFSAMFYGQKEAKETIELPGKKAWKILWLLRCLIPTNNKIIHGDNVVAMSKLADEYQIAVLAISCDSFLRSMDEDHSSLMTIFKDGIKFGQKKTVRACLPLIARLEPLMDGFDSMMDEIPDKVRSAILYQKLGQTRSHGANLFDTTIDGRSGLQCSLCDYFISREDLKFIDYSRCDVCKTCNKKTQWQSILEIDEKCCRCIDPKASAELDKMSL